MRAGDDGLRVIVTSREPLGVAAETVWPDRVDVGLVETAGGVRSPQADDGDTVDLIARLRPDRVVLVADAGLGTINAVRLGVDVLVGPAPVTVALNRFDGRNHLHAANRAWLTDRVGLDVVAGPAGLDTLADRVAGRLG